jgi:hypothetical protein
MEVAAVAHVSTWVGESGVVRDRGDGHEPDFKIEYHDGRIGWGEVGWHEDREVRALHKEIQKHDRVVLAPGLGQWAVHLFNKSKIKTLRRELPRFIEQLDIDGIDELSPYADDILPAQFEMRASELGIEEVRRMSQGDVDEAYFISPGGGGVVSSDTNTVVDWVDQMLADPNYADTTNKLLRLEADERHVFLFMGSLTPTGVTILMVRPLRALPTKAPQVPTGITNVWTLSTFGKGDLLMWSVAGGWCSTPVA